MFRFGMEREGESTKWGVKVLRETYRPFRSNVTANVFFSVNESRALGRYFLGLLVGFVGFLVVC